MKYAALWLLVGALRFAQPSRYNLGYPCPARSPPPSLTFPRATRHALRGCNGDLSPRASAADRVVYIWWSNPGSRAFRRESCRYRGFSGKRATFARIREANGLPPLARVPPDQDAEEFELHFPDDIALDVLTTGDPVGKRHCALPCEIWGRRATSGVPLQHVDRATQILKENFGVQPIYPQTRRRRRTRVNFFLVPSINSGKILIELYET